MTLHVVPAFSRIGEENAFAVLARATELQRQGKDIINLGIGQPDFPTPDHIVEAAVKALRDGQHGYTPANGILPLREAVAADLHKRFQVSVSPEEVMIVPGGKVTMFMAILMFGEPGAEILYPDPGFPIYRSMIEFTGATPVPVPIREENGFAFSAEETLSLITPRTRLLIINSPANPTGGVTPKAEVDKLVAGLARFPDVAVMSDEIYDQLLYDGEKHVCLLSYPEIRDRLILLNGWSKTYAMTGWRMGYSVWPKPLYDNARKLAVNSHSSGPASRRSPARRTRCTPWRPSSTGAARRWSPGSTPWRTSPAPRRRAPSTPSPTSRRPDGRPRSWPPPCSRTPASPRSAARISA
jgi:aspartate aminotransferase